MMNYKKILLLSVLSFSLLLEAKQASIREITATQLLTMIQEKEQGKNNDLLVINVLNAEAYRDCHIESSINLPMVSVLQNRAKHRLNSGKWKKDKPIVVYCSNAHCPVTRHAYRLLTGLGYTNVWAYQAGMKDWIDHKYPCVGFCQAGYLNSH